MRQQHRAVVMSIGVGLALPVIAAAETRYVSLTGTDEWANSCAQNNPCRTISHAVQMAGEGDTVLIGSGLFVENGPVIVNKALTIEGAGVSSTVVKPQSNTVGPAFNVPFMKKTVTIRGLEIREGRGGISNGATLTVEDVDIVSCTHGGVVNTASSLTMRRVNISGNQGAALDNYPNGFALVTEFGFSGNSGTPGGVYNKGTLFMHSGFITDNTGVQAAGIANSGLMYLTNVTISRNTASEQPLLSGHTGYSGGVANLGGQAYLVHVTVTQNSGYFSGGIGSSDGGRVFLRNTIVAGNTSPQCELHFDGNTVQGDITGAGNLTGDSSCNLWPAPADGSGSANQIGGDPALMPLADHGGTLVHALMPGSPAIDAGYPQYCLKADQRGVARPVDGDQDGTARCDIGAYEYNFEVGGGSRDDQAYWLFRGHWFRRGPSDHAFRRDSIRRE